MRVIMFFAAAIFAGTVHLRAQSEPPLRFESEEWGFAEIAEDGGEVKHVFEFTNTGATPVAIDRVVTSCGCTTPEYPTEPILPGEKASITVIFDPMGFIGEVTKTVTVVSGGGKYRNQLSISGLITPRKRSLEEEFPFDMGGGLRLDGNVLAFGTLAQGRSAARAIKYVNTSGRDITFDIEPAEESGALEIFAPETICAGCEGNITLTYDLSVRRVYGPMHDMLMVLVDGVPSLKTIYAATTGVDNFSNVNLDAAPKLVLDSQYRDFDTVKRREMPYIFRIVALNEGKETLQIRSVTENEGSRITLRAGASIAPGESLPFELVLDSDEFEPGKVRESIIVVVNDPMRPVREIRIAAEIE